MNRAQGAFCAETTPTGQTPFVQGSLWRAARVQPTQGLVGTPTHTRDAISCNRRQSPSEIVIPRAQSVSRVRYLGIKSPVTSTTKVRFWSFPTARARAKRAPGPPISHTHRSRCSCCEGTYFPLSEICRCMPPRSCSEEAAVKSVGYLRRCTSAAARAAPRPPGAARPRRAPRARIV